MDSFEKDASVMDRVLCIDPGASCTGWALFSHKSVLLRAEHVSASAADRDVPAHVYAARVAETILFRVGAPVRLLTVLIEVPRIHLATKIIRGAGADPNALMGLAQFAGVIMGVFFGRGVVVRRVQPAQWKGTVPKTIMVERVRARLAAPEVLRVTLPNAASAHHNVWDAVGIGLAFFGRLKMKTTPEASHVFEASHAPAKAAP
ncbi:MAG: hypothetical protein ACYC6M_15345 [Terriglobales bacterium]